jgi:hypothetical protein
MCIDCHAVLRERLAEEELTLEDLVFGTPPESEASDAEIRAWNAHSERVYRARFVLARVRNTRRR